MPRLMFALVAAGFASMVSLLGPTTLTDRELARHEAGGWVERCLFTNVGCKLCASYGADWIKCAAGPDEHFCVYGGVFCTELPNHQCTNCPTYNNAGCAGIPIGVGNRFISQCS